MEIPQLERLRILRAEIAQIMEQTREYNETSNPSLAQTQNHELMRGRLEEIVRELSDMRITPE